MTRQHMFGFLSASQQDFLPSVFNSRVSLPISHITVNAVAYGVLSGAEAMSLSEDWVDLGAPSVVSADTTEASRPGHVAQQVP